MECPSRMILGLLLLACVAAARQPSPVRVDQKPAVVERRAFSLYDPPRDMPPLEPNEAALTKSSFSVATEARAEVVSETSRNGRYHSTVKIKSVNLTTGLKITIWLPEDASPELQDHEEGHRRLGEHFYKGASAIARSIATPYIGKTYSGEGKTADAARKAAIAKATSAINSAYMQATESAAARVNAIFDDVTEHGLSDDIPAEEGMQLALELYRKESRRKR